MKHRSKEWQRFFADALQGAAFSEHDAPTLVQRAEKIADTAEARCVEIEKQGDAKEAKEAR